MGTPRTLPPAESTAFQARPYLEVALALQDRPFYPASQIAGPPVLELPHSVRDPTRGLFDKQDVQL